MLIKAEFDAIVVKKAAELAADLRFIERMHERLDDSKPLSGNWAGVAGWMFDPNDRNA